MASKLAARYFLFALIAGAAIITFDIFQPFIAPLSLAAVFAVILQPLYLWVRRVLSPWDSLASLATVVISIVCLLLPLAFLTSIVIREAQQVYDTEGASSRLDSALSHVDRFVGPIVPGISSIRAQVSTNVDQYTKQAVQWLIEHVAVAFTSVAGVLLDVFIFIVALYYFLRDGEKFKREIMRISPLSTADEERIFHTLGLAVNSVVRGSLLIALVQSILATIGFSIFGVPQSILWGSATFFAALIPGVGTALVTVPAIGFLVLSGAIVPAIGLMLWGALGVGLIDNFLGPKLVSHGLELHTLVILPAVLGGIMFFGPVGIFLGPLALSFFFTLLSIYSAKEKDEESA